MLLMFIVFIDTIHMKKDSENFPWNIYVFLPCKYLWPIVTYPVTISRTLGKVLCLEKEPRDFR